MDADTHRIAAGAYNLSEGPEQLSAFFTALAAQCLSPRSATVDGNPSQSLCLTATWPAIILQRCVVHVNRQGLSWCRNHPHRTEAIHLRQLFIELNTVSTAEQRDTFLTHYDTWERRFGYRFKKSTHRAYVASDLSKARNMLRRALPTLFPFLDNDRIPRTSNAIEGYFGRMKEHYRRHRGMAKKNRSAFFQWYFFLVSK